MKLWISGAVDADVGDAFRVTMNKIEAEVNRLLEQSSYGEGISSWDVIMMISAEPGQEMFKYNKRSKETDIHVQINHHDFLNASEPQKRQLFLDALVRSIEGLTTKTKIDDLASHRLIGDLNKLKHAV